MDEDDWIDYDDDEEESDVKASAKNDQVTQQER